MNTVISAKNLSKKYIIHHSTRPHYQTFRDALTQITKNAFRKLYSPPVNRLNKTESLWALKDISFKVEQGERIGIIGNNGSGKSTLLKILSRITSPTTGKALINGRVSCLLEVGTGFHPELTGRENVFLNGAIMGMTRKEIRKKFDEIVAFAEIERFLDTPVKRYSSGMYVRLAFAVAAHLEPEILLVDEVLAVGDVQFQKKCLGKMNEVAKEGRTVLFVSHNMSAVNNLCTRGIVLESGKSIFQGKAEEAVQYYLDYMNNIACDEESTGDVYFESDEKKHLQMRRVYLTDSNNNIKNVFEYNENVMINICFDLRVPSSNYYTLLLLTDVYGNIIFITTDEDFCESPVSNLPEGEYQYKVKLPNCLLKPGKYHLMVSFTRRYYKAVDRRDSVLSFEIIDHTTRRGIHNGYRKKSITAPEIRWAIESF